MYVISFSFSRVQRRRVTRGSRAGNDRLPLPLAHLRAPAPTLFHVADARKCVNKILYIEWRAEKKKMTRKTRRKTKTFRGP